MQQPGLFLPEAKKKKNMEEEKKAKKVFKQSHIDWSRNDEKVIDSVKHFLVAIVARRERMHMTFGAIMTILLLLRPLSTKPKINWL